MVVLAFDGLTSFSSHPLRVSWLFGMMLVGVATLYAVYSLIEHNRGNTVPGWMSIMMMTMVLGGVQLFSIGMLGEYIGRIFREVKNRPLYFIQSDTLESPQSNRRVVERSAQTNDLSEESAAAEATPNI